jgi:hypothetical protein
MLVDPLLRLVFGDRDRLGADLDLALGVALGQRVNQPLLVVSLGVIFAGVAAPAFLPVDRADRRDFRQVEQRANS